MAVKGQRSPRRVPRTPLARMVDDVLTGEGISDPILAARATRAGHPISKQRISRLCIEDPLPSIVPSNVRALAAALGQPVPRVLEVFLASAGLPTPSLPSDWSIEAAIDADPDLPLAAKRMLHAQLAAARSGTHDAAPVLHAARAPTPDAERNREQP